MCNSLADGGLRCAAHVSNDINRLEKEYQFNLEKAAEKANVPVNADTLQKFTEGYKTEMNELKEQILLAHKAAMASKSGKLSTVNTPMGEFSSIGKDLEGVRKKIKARFDRLVDISEGAPTNTQILSNPALNQMERKSDYIDAIHLHKEYTNQQSDLHERIRNSEGFDGTKRMSDYPEESRQIEVIRAQKEALEAYMAPLRKEYRQHQQNYPYQEAKDIAVIEHQITQTPRPKSMKKLDYVMKANVFKKLKSDFETRAGKEGTSASAMKEYAQSHGMPLFSREPLEKFRKDVYDKSSMGVAMNERITEKKKQLQLSTTYRKDLARRAASIEESHPNKAKELLERKSILDRLAEQEMAKNRARAAQIAAKR